jgi:hypothetical protein
VQNRQSPGPALRPVPDVPLPSMRPLLSSGPHGLPLVPARHMLQTIAANVCSEPTPGAKRCQAAGGDESRRALRPIVVAPRELRHDRSSWRRRELRHDQSRGDAENCGFEGRRTPGVARYGSYRPTTRHTLGVRRRRRRRAGRLWPPQADRSAGRRPVVTADQADLEADAAGGGALRQRSLNARRVPGRRLRRARPMVRRRAVARSRTMQRGPPEGQVAVQPVRSTSLRPRRRRIARPWRRNVGFALLPTGPPSGVPRGSGVPPSGGCGAGGDPYS